MIRVRSLLLAGGIALCAFSTVQAAPPPPPPAYIVAIARVVVPDQTAASFDSYMKLLADDLIVTVDDKQVTAGKAAWVAIERHRLGKVDRTMVAHVEGYDTLLVIDRYDDRSNLPDTPGMFFDPRYVVRAVQYQVGSDHLVHSIRIVQSPGLLQTGVPK